MSPTIVFDEDGNVGIVTGSPSGTDIEAPIPGVTLYYDAAALEIALEDNAHSVRIRDLTSGLSIIQVQKKPGKHRDREDNDDDENEGKKRARTILIGGADQRRDGTVGGR